jgi:hypothetical protein
MRSFVVGVVAFAAIGGVLGLPAQVPVPDSLAAATGGTALRNADSLAAAGQPDSATAVLGRHILAQPNDGRAWFVLGRLHLDAARRWHLDGHPADIASGTLLDFASASFERSQELLADSGNVFRVVVDVERATLEAERVGWDSVAALRLRAEDVPLPPVLAELGHNLLASCPRNGVLVASSVPELVAIWGARLQGERPDLVLLRPDLYRADMHYRTGMAGSLNSDSTFELAAALAAASRFRPVCLAPGLDSTINTTLIWRPSRMVLTTATATVTSTGDLSIFHFARTGLAGSLWTAAVRDVYERAAQHNHALCLGLFAPTDVYQIPTLPTCTQ